MKKFTVMIAIAMAIATSSRATELVLPPPPAPPSAELAQIIAQLPDVSHVHLSAGEIDALTRVIFAQVILSLQNADVRIDDHTADMVWQLASNAVGRMTSYSDMVSDNPGYHKDAGDFFMDFVKDTAKDAAGLTAGAVAADKVGIGKTAVEGGMVSDVAAVMETGFFYEKGAVVGCAIGAGVAGIEIGLSFNQFIFNTTDHTVGNWVGDLWDHVLHDVWYIGAAIAHEQAQKRQETNDHASEGEHEPKNDGTPNPDADNGPAHLQPFTGLPLQPTLPDTSVTHPNPAADAPPSGIDPITGKPYPVVVPGTHADAPAPGNAFRTPIMLNPGLIAALKRPNAAWILFTPDMLNQLRGAGLH